jgi:hypothetical protein
MAGEATAGAKGGEWSKTRFRHPKEFPAIRPDTLQPVGSAPPPSNGSKGNGGARSAAQVPPETPAPPPRRLGVVAESGLYRRIGTHELEAPAQEDPGPPPRILQESVIPSSQRLPLIDIGRDLSTETGGLTDSTLEAVFMEVTQLFEGHQSLEGAVGFALDLAMRRLHSESGSVLFVDEAGSKLYFAAARGPKAKELLARDFQVPLGAGIAGFCTREGVSVAISDAPRDPRFYRDVSESLGYPVKSILCSPILWDGQSFGALELINRAGRAVFTGAEMNALAYIAAQMGRYLVGARL